MIYRFGMCTLDTQTHELYREGHIVPLQPKVFQVLTYLIAHRQRLVTKQELLEQVWSRQFVHDSVIARCIMEARKAIGDREGSPHSIVTLRSQGYRFTAAVTDHVDAAPHAEAQEVHVASRSPASLVQDVPAWSYGSAIPTMPPPTLCFASSVHTVECKWVTVLCCTLVGATVM